MRRRIQILVAKLSLVDRFRLASSIVLIVALVAIGAWIARMIDNGVIRVTSSTTALYMESIVAPQLEELAQGHALSSASVDTLDRMLQNTALRNRIVAFKIWGPGGRVNYASDHSSIGRVFAVEPRLAQAWNGETVTRISHLDSDENASERLVSNELLETYSPLHLNGSTQTFAVAEFYQNVDDLKAEISRAQIGSWLVMTVVMLGIYLLLAGFVERSGRTIARQQGELSQQVTRLQELLGQNAELHARARRASAQTAAINERFLRRIGAELHDGPVQELSLALLHIDPVPEDPAVPSPETVILSARDAAVIQRALRHALDEVRAISAGLGLPELGALSLAEVVNRVVQAHEARTGTKVTLRTNDLPDQPPLSVKITVYRLIQEALTNAYRHAGGAGQDVTVEGTGDTVRVVVSDSGPGFDIVHAGNGDGRSHLGLAGMRERVQSLGGTFGIESTPGRGTTIRSALSLRVSEDGSGG